MTENLEQRIAGKSLPLKIKLGEYFLNPFYLITLQMVRVPASEFKMVATEKKLAVTYSLLADSSKIVGYAVLGVAVLHYLTSR